MLSFKKIEATAVYHPAGASSTDRLAFLSWGQGAEISGEDVWAARGMPKVPGYYLLLNRQPSLEEASAIEKLLYTDPAGPKLPQKPNVTALIWLRLSDSEGPKVVSIVPTALGADETPEVCADVPMFNAPGIRGFGFGKGGAIIGKTEAGNWTSLSVYAPPQPARGLQPPSWSSPGPGVSVSLALADAGTCKFRALCGTQARTGKTVEMSLLDILADPVEPQNSTETITGAYFVLDEDDTGIHLRTSGQQLE